MGPAPGARWSASGAHAGEAKAVSRGRARGSGQRPAPSRFPGRAGRLRNKFLRENRGAKRLQPGVGLCVVPFLALVFMV